MSGAGCEFFPSDDKGLHETNKLLQKVFFWPFLENSINTTIRYGKKSRTG